MWELLSEDEQNEVLIKLLIAMTKADEILKQEELAYIIYVAERLNIDFEYIKNEINNKTLPNEILPTDEPERAKILFHLLFAVNSDGEVLPEEEKMIYNFGFKLGFHEEMTREFIELMKLYKIKELPKDAMTNILKKYLN
jgi:uncharacterized tellurite resistance protein B-like protein